MSPYGQLIAHGPAHDEQRSFMAGQVGHVAFQVVRDGILAEDIVEKAAVRESMEHGCCRCRYDIA